jgi:chromosome partitioning protein
LVIDTPPGNPAISRSAVLAVDLVVIPTSPTLVDLDRLLPTLDLLIEVGDQHAFDTRILLTRVRPRTVSGRAARDYLLSDEIDLPLLATTIPLRESYGASFGLVVEDLGEYAEALAELTAIRTPA